MYLRFNEGAIVKFTVIGSATPVNIVGKVLKVHPDEVELLPQLGVYRKSTHAYGSNLTLDYSSTADSDKSIHINRQLILGWCYATVRDLDVSKGNIQEDDFNIFSALDRKPFSSYTFNYFSPDGYHRGDGPYCGEIKAEPSNIILCIPKAEDNNGMFMAQSM